MNDRILPRGRVVALMVIAVLAAGLVYLRIGSGDEQVVVPAGAKTGDLKLAPCTVGLEGGSYKADCGTLVVPEKRADPNSRLIALPVTRIHARSGATGEPVFRLEGGPGLTNAVWPKASRVADTHDVVLIGYRGVDGSSVLDCPEVVSALKHSKDFLSQESFRAYADGFRACAGRLQRSGVDLAGYTLAQRVDDLEAARVALAYPRINLVSESAGTRTAMIYAWRYPASILRSVMIGVNPPGHFLFDPRTTDEQLQRYAVQCSRDDVCGKRTNDLAASMRRTSSQIPGRWWLLRIRNGNALVASFFGFVDSSSDAAPISSPMTVHTWLSAAKGDPSGFWFLSFAAELVFPEVFVWGDLGAVGRVDARAAKEHFSANGQTYDSILDDAASAFMWGGGALADAWPAAPGETEYDSVRPSDVETLLVGGSLDFSTPPQIATSELLPKLSHGKQVLLEGFGHTTDFWAYQPAANKRLLNTFLDSGAVDDSLYKAASVDFTPEVTHTALAKGTAGTMVGFAIAMILSLAWWMPRRVRKRGSFGRRSSATLRSLYPIVLGLGGWFVGVLIVETVLPGVPLDNQILAVLPIGVPVGLGIYFAWVQRDQPASRKQAGMAAAGGGGLAGAWLGFHASSGLLSLITGIVGAALAANLALIILDISRARSLMNAGPEPSVALASTSEG
ncbi:MAG: alpha/beta hydrolase [Actinomycetota bacterium]